MYCLVQVRSIEHPRQPASIEELYLPADGPFPRRFAECTGARNDTAVRSSRGHFAVEFPHYVYADGGAQMLALHQISLAVPPRLQVDSAIRPRLIGRILPDCIPLLAQCNRRQPLKFSPIRLRDHVGTRAFRLPVPPRQQSYRRSNCQPRLAYPRQGPPPATHRLDGALQHHPRTDRDQRWSIRVGCGTR